MLRKIRVILAAVFFTLITLLLLDFTGATHHWLGWMAKVQFLPAVLALNAGVIIGLVVLTLIFGRIYCSVICPLGVFQDIVSWLHGRKKKNRFFYSKEKRWLRYPLLAVYIAGSLAGLGTIVALLAPYGTYGRFVNSLLQPLYMWGNNAMAWVATKADSYMFYSADVWLKGAAPFIASTAIIVVVAVLAWRGGRTWCNTICPVGTVLSLLARFSWFKVYFDQDKCKKCSLCSKNCKSACIDFKNYKVDYSRCVTCGVCLDHCHFDALHYGHPKRKAKTEASDKAASPTRRAVLLGTALVAADVAMATAKKKVDGGLAVLEPKKDPGRSTPLTPPGSMSASNMSQHCVGCQLCVAQCPNGVLRPSSDPMHFMQPVMSYDRGACRPECTRCSQVCPAGAIKPITAIEKSSIQIGHAVWRKKYCVVVTDHVQCGNCARHCPAGAIQMVPIDPADDLSDLIPAVNVEKCIGCGMCEYVCPARPNSAIYVEGHPVHRII
ncbi:MAG: 4Fe-4S binding protein [Sodaliphilus pleomorphus]|uniref:4Fe-4S binding protein n=1 Tax=Sodaliphilus pleomorphus TaxID=2606626 RepID=UPI002408FE9D|nr:4Fe-4S binding protein [Sodaliphilus pleomorphus]MDD6475059.1 4Fe-4S binding protein [Sodaliphilus pleomorphus]